MLGGTQEPKKSSDKPSHLHIFITTIIITVTPTTTWKEHEKESYFPYLIKTQYVYLMENTIRIRSVYVRKAFNYQAVHLGWSWHKMGAKHLTSTVGWCAPRPLPYWHVLCAYWLSAHVRSLAWLISSKISFFHCRWVFLERCSVFIFPFGHFQVNL